MGKAKSASKYRDMENMEEKINKIAWQNVRAWKWSKLLINKVNQLPLETVQVESYKDKLNVEECINYVTYGM